MEQALNAECQVCLVVISKTLKNQVVTGSHIHNNTRNNNRIFKNEVVAGKFTQV
jgi:hypothetical protein